jgi:hypothetical protein
MPLSITGGHTDHEGRDVQCMVVDGKGVTLDLTGIGRLWDPTVQEIAWGPTMKMGEPQESGWVRLKNGTGRTFADATLLVPYLKAHKARFLELAKEMSTHEAQRPSW